MTSPMELLKQQVHADPEFAWALHCNLAMPILDSVPYANPLTANQAAAYIMSLWFDYDITTDERYRCMGKGQAQKYYEARVEAERAKQEPPNKDTAPDEG